MHYQSSDGTTIVLEVPWGGNEAKWAETNWIPEASIMFNHSETHEPWVFIYQGEKE